MTVQDYVNGGAVKVRVVFSPVVLCIKNKIIISNTALKEGRSQHQTIVCHTQTGQ